MAKDNQHTDQKSHRKWPWILLISIFALVGLARLALLTGPVHRQVKKLIVNVANDQLKPRLSIGELSGDLWNGVTLTDITLTEEDTVASIDTLHLAYSPLSYFDDAFKIYEIDIVAPQVKIKQQADSSWNVEHWYSSADTSSSSFGVSISDIQIKRGYLTIHPIQLPQDSSFKINDLTLGGQLGYYGDTYSADINDFHLSVADTRLDAPITVNSSAQADEQSVDLQKLVVGTGHSRLQVSGQANLADSTGEFHFKADPLGWKDLAAYVDSLPAQKNLRLSLKGKAQNNQIEVELDANADGLEQINVQATIRRDDGFALTDFRTTADQLDMATFLDDTTMPSLQQLDINLAGRVPFDDYQKGHLQGTLAAANIRQGDYELDKLEGTANWQKARADLTLLPQKNGEEIRAKASVDQLWAEAPSLRLTVKGTGINPAKWMQDTTYAGQLNFRADVSGQGWVPGQQFWQYQFEMNDSKIHGEPLDSVRLSGRFNQDEVTNRSLLTSHVGRLTISAEAQNLQSTPVFSYNMLARRVDVSKLPGLKDYPSSINARIDGKGQGQSMENLKMQTQVRVDSSIFKTESIRNFSINAQVDSSILSVSRGVLQSGISDANLSGRLNLNDYDDTQNRLDFNLQLKDISVFQSAAEVKPLHGGGTIQGAIRPAGPDSLAFNGQVDLKNINYDDQFIAKAINGHLRVSVDKQPAYAADLHISQPVISSVSLQNVDLKTDGRYAEAGPRGTFDMQLAGADEGQLTQQGRYRVSDDSALVTLTNIDLTTSLRTLSLSQPFHAAYANGALKTDTLKIQTKDQAAFLSLAIPYADSLHQKGSLKADKLNLKAIQNVLFKKTYFQGMLQAGLQFDRTDTSLTAAGQIAMTKIKYHDTQLDTLRLRADIKNERLEGSMALVQDSLRIAEGDLDIPFEAAKPDKLPEDFFQKPVEGHLTLHKLKLDRFSSLLEQAGYLNLEGNIQFDSKLKGEAGQPKFDAKLTFTDGQLSGVPVDSLVAGAHYEHSSSRLDFNATLTSLHQKALDVQAKMPLKLDLRSLEMNLPGPDDSLQVDLQTNNFNLKALNNFVDEATARKISGRIDGHVQVRGPRKNLQASGQLTLKKGAVRVVPAGIRLDHMASTISFQPDAIVLENFHTESGKGDLDAEGKLGIKQLVAGDIDVSIKAENFKALNTDEYNALINLDASVGGSVTKPKVSGKLSVINGFVELDNFGEKSVENIQLDTTAAPEMQTSLYDSLALDMNIAFNKRFYVRNKRYLKMEVELDGNIDVKKNSGQDLQIFGTLNTTNGYAEPLGKRFELKEGSLAFSGPPDNPKLNIRTLYQPPQTDQEIKIYYIIEGTVEDPQFKYESTPPMDLSGIISYTLFGQPFYKLNPAEQSVAGSSGNNVAADIAMDVLMDRIESVATRRLGIDVVRIEQTRVGGKSGTSVTTGWYVNPKVFFAIQNVITGSTPSTGFYLEYYLKKHLKLILSQGNDNRQGVDIQWEHDY